MADLVQPTKPPTGYWLWLSDKRSALTKELGKTKGSEVAKFAGERWKALSAADKKPYEDKAAKAKKEYDSKMEEFLAAGGVKNKRKMKESKDGKQGGKKARADARAASGMPKRPPSAYFQFMKENQEAIRKEVGPGKTASAVGALGGQKWKAMTAAQKKPYEDKVAKMKAEWTKAMEAWKKNGGGANAEAGDEEDDDDNEEEQ
mmetsp:Transcript_31853/g.47636  ORF Transcript_31853/g.47636 Transcript_31853/m.47636 type:complete len:203 (+) Transcript_31853:70-678(+)